jgi:NADH-quinone oxidoreductase subunit C
MDASDVLQVLRETVADAALQDVPSIDMPTILADREHIIDVCEALRDHPDLQFSLLIDVTAADYLPAAMRYEVVYHLVCLGAAFAHGTPAPARRLRVKVRVPGDDARLPSIVSVFPAANWPERELFDLFGLVFEGHPDLRRILMPDDWEGHPLRKDYPVQIRKDTAAWEPIQLSAEEFAENIRAQREQASRAARTTGPPDRG